MSVTMSMVQCQRGGTDARTEDETLTELHEVDYDRGSETGTHTSTGDVVWQLWLWCDRFKISDN